MRKETPALRKKRLAEAQRVIEGIIAREHVRVQDIMRNGPRYYIAWGTRGAQRVVFKICLFTDTVDHLTNEKFSREILFLHFLATSHHATVRAGAPRLMNHGIRPRAWYVREFLSGKQQNRGGSVRYAPSFFQLSTVRWIVRFFWSLQAIQKRELPASFLRLLYLPDLTHDLMKFMRPHWRLIGQFVGQQGVSKQIIRYLQSKGARYNNAPRVLAHQEPYADHFLKIRGGFHLIDWENIGWSNPLHDIVTIWMRAASRPDWQRALYRSFKKRSGSPAWFDELWEIETMIQSVFNIISYHFYPHKKDLRELTLFSKKNVHQILSNAFHPTP